MIDVLPQIIQGIKAKLDSSINGMGIRVSDTYLYSTPTFPCVTIEEMYNQLSDGEMDLVEKHSILMYEINIYDNSIRKIENCRKIAKTIDEYMGSLGFLRIMGEPFPNTADSKVYRYLLRYEGYIDNETGNISRTLN